MCTFHAACLLGVLLSKDDQWIFDVRSPISACCTRGGEAGTVEESAQVLTRNKTNKTEQNKHTNTHAHARTHAHHTTKNHKQTTTKRTTTTKQQQQQQQQFFILSCAELNRDHWSRRSEC